MSVEIEVEADGWSAVPGVEAVVQRAVGAALAIADSNGDGTLTILLTDDIAVRSLNARFRGKDAATNVLSFPAAATAHGHLGDIALAYETCAREAAAQGKLLSNHLAHLTAHGVLHLLGWDHEDDGEAEAMEDAERAAMSRLGLPDPYAIGGAEPRGSPD